MSQHPVDRVHTRWRALVAAVIGASLCFAIVARKSRPELEPAAAEPTTRASPSLRGGDAHDSAHRPASSQSAEDLPAAAWRAELQEELFDFEEACGLGDPLDMVCDGDLCAIRAPENEDRGLPYLKTLWRRPGNLLFRSLADWGVMHPTDTPCMSARMKIARRSASPAVDAQDGHEPPFCYVQHRSRTHPRYHGEEGALMAALCNALAEHHGDADRVRYLTPSERPTSVVP